MQATITGLSTFRALNHYAPPVSGDRKWQLIIAGAFFNCIIAWFQYTSTHMHVVPLSMLYAFPIALVGWYVGAVAAVIFTLANIALYTGIVLLVGPAATISTILAPLLRLVAFSLIGVFAGRLNHIQQNLEAIAEARAEALSTEKAERMRLEQEMLEISEREQRRIGQDLHDGLCQLLTGASLINHALARRLDSQHLTGEAETAKKGISIIEEAISLSRRIAKGLDPVELKNVGLMQALEEFADTASDLFGVDCTFVCPSPVLIESSAVATHLYRIVQEAVGNAIKHGRATAICISLEEVDAGLRLSVADNGEGFEPRKSGAVGMGLRTMTVRSKFIGADFSIERKAEGRGTEVACFLPEDVLV